MTKINRLTPPDNRMLPFSLEAVKNGKNLVTRIGVLVRDLHVLERRTKERYFKGQVLTVVSAPQIRTHTNDERDCTDESKLGILEHAVEWREDGTTTFATETNPYDMFVLKDKVNIADLPKAQKLVYDPRVDNSLENWIKDPKILEIYNVSNLYNPKHINLDSGSIVGTGKRYCVGERITAYFIETGGKFKNKSIQDDVTYEVIKPFYESILQKFKRGENTNSFAFADYGELTKASNFLIVGGYVKEADASERDEFESIYGEGSFSGEGF